MASFSLVIALVLVGCSGAMGCCNRCLETDFCVKDNSHYAAMKGFRCKDPKKVMAEDFFSSGLNRPGNTSNSLGSNVTSVGVEQIPGLNQLGLSVARIDFAPGGVNPPHFHPRGTEIIIVIQGTISVGFITADGRLIIKVLVRGDIFVFPKGLIHLQINIGIDVGIVISALSNETPGNILVANSIFGSNPPIPNDVLTRAFGADTHTIKINNTVP